MLCSDRAVSDGRRAAKTDVCGQMTVVVRDWLVMMLLDDAADDDVETMSAGGNETCG